MSEFNEIAVKTYMKLAMMMAVEEGLGSRYCTVEQFDADIDLYYNELLVKYSPEHLFESAARLTFNIRKDWYYLEVDEL